MNDLPSPGEMAFWREMHPNWSFVGEMATASGLAQSTVSEMLKSLHEKGFVKRKASGKFRYYRPQERIVLVRNQAQGGQKE